VEEKRRKDIEERNIQKAAETQFGLKVQRDVGGVF